MDYKQINEHMKNKFQNNDKILQLKNLPDEQKLDSMADNQIYEVPFVCIFVDVVNFKKLTEYTDPKIVNSIMSEFTYGVTKIIKEYYGYRIQIQGDGIYGIFNGLTKKEIDNVFRCACALNSFQNHLNKNIKKYFDNDVNYDNYYGGYTDNIFKFGIGLYFSVENYISKVGHGASRDLIFMGESVSRAAVLAKLANRNSKEKILMNELVKINFSDDSNLVKNNFSGFVQTYITDLDEYVWGCNWIISTYENFVENNV